MNEKLGFVVGHGAADLLRSSLSELQRVLAWIQSNIFLEDVLQFLSQLRLIDLSREIEGRMLMEGTEALVEKILRSVSRNLPAEVQRRGGIKRINERVQIPSLNETKPSNTSVAPSSRLT